jgi:hypothetical protein
MATTKQEHKMRGLELSVDTIVDILSNTDSFILEEMLERLVEVDPGTAYVIQHVLNNLEKEMA